MEQLLHNPVYYALLSGNADLGFGTNTVKCFHEEVSPFVGFPESYGDGFEDLSRYNYLLLDGGVQLAVHMHLAFLFHS